MITAIISAPTAKQGAVAKAAMYQGQWGFLSGVDANGEAYVTPVTTTGHGGYNANRLFPIQYWPTTNEEEETYQDSTAIPSGYRVVGYVGGNVVIEDNYVYTRVGSGTYVSGTVGDYMFLNTSGYPIVANAGNVGTATGATPIGVFLGLQGTKVVYKTIIAASGVTI